MTDRLMAVRHFSSADDFDCAGLRAFNGEQEGRDQWLEIDKLIGSCANDDDRDRIGGKILLK
jgi:hypothetical protein